MAFTLFVVFDIWRLHIDGRSTAPWGLKPRNADLIFFDSVISQPDLQSFNGIEPSLPQSAAAFLHLFDAWGVGTNAAPNFQDACCVPDRDPRIWHIQHHRVRGLVGNAPKPMFFARVAVRHGYDRIQMERTEFLLCECDPVLVELKGVNVAAWGYGAGKGDRQGAAPSARFDHDASRAQPEVAYDDGLVGGLNDLRPFLSAMAHKVGETWRMYKCPTPPDDGTSLEPYGFPIMSS